MLKVGNEFLNKKKYQNMKNAKKTDTVPGDVPKSVLKEFLPEFAYPVTAIIKEAINTHQAWPKGKAQHPGNSR